MTKNTVDVITLLNQAKEALYNVPVVGDAYDQQHSDTHTAAAKAIEDALQILSGGVPAETSETSVKVRHWDQYASNAFAETHQIDIADQRKTNGQVFVTAGVLEGNIDEMLSVTLEITSNPLNDAEHVPCAHIHFDHDALAMSLFKVGNMILLRPETEVQLQYVRELVNGAPEDLYWVS